jgi:hypothetical protein
MDSSQIAAHRSKKEVPKDAQFFVELAGMLIF